MTVREGFGAEGISLEVGNTTVLDCGERSWIEKVFDEMWSLRSQEEMEPESWTRGGRLLTEMEGK